MRLGRTLALLLATWGPLARAEPRPTLDDFYDRTRSRTEGFDRCLGHCDGQTLAAFLIGAQVADPTTDAVQRATAYGGRFGIDLGVFFGRYDVARTKLWADFLRVAQQNETVTDLAWKNTWFWSASDPDHEGLHLSFDSMLAKRSELEPSDLAELQLVPYQSADVELEAAPIGPKVDKDTSLALPVGAATRLRWSESGATLERRQSFSGALAFRGFLKQVRHHYQLDALRVKRTAWEVRGGDATAWSVSAGYQRLSPDVDWLQIWLLAGYAWNSGQNSQRGFLAQLGAETRFPFESGELELGPAYEAHFVLDQRTAHFERVHEVRLYYRQRWGVVRWGLAYQGVALEDLAKLHALTPELGVRLLGLDLGLRYRFAVVRDDRFPGMPENRFNAMLDFVF
ncbi:MAG: hypothetical protein HYZ29_20460 [Myxococcales bacterium]|nr:hypothetical protein [Myxococcales bacterium]